MNDRQATLHDAWSTSGKLSAEAKAELEKMGLGNHDGPRAAGLDPVAGRPLIPKAATRSPEVLNEAYDYGLPSSFSRGMRVDLPGATMLFLSGTASIDEQGRSVHPGDFEAQLLRTLRNLTGLLAAEGASWHDIVRTSCYLRDIERDYDTFNRVRTAFMNQLGLDPLPASTGIQARICRSDLLVEIEALAIIPPGVEPMNRIRRSSSRSAWLLAALLCALTAGATAYAAGPSSGERGEAVTSAVESQEPHGRTPEPLRPYRRSGDPYRRFFVDPLAFRGPGRDLAAPEGLESVRIGLLAPLEGTLEDHLGESLRRGVEFALDEANARGGYGGLPYELIARNDQALWGSSGNTLVELAYVQRVWAMIGSIDSNSTHVALRAALKAELPMVNVGSADPTVTETGIPWIVRVTPDDRQTGYRLASLLFEERGYTRVAVVRGSDRYGRFGVKEFRDAARRMGRPLPMEILIAEGQEDLATPLSRIAASDVEAVVMWIRSTEDAARILREMRRAGMRQPVVGTDRLVSPRFLELAGADAEGIEATCWMNPQRADESWTRFREAFGGRYGDEPDVFAAYAYDAAQLVLVAIRDQGLNRVRIRDALMGLRTYRGVTGEMRFDTTSSNVTTPLLARVEGGRFVFR